MCNITTLASMTLMDSAEWNSFQRKESRQSFPLDGPFCLEEEPKVKVNIISLVLLFGLDYENWGGTICKLGFSLFFFPSANSSNGTSHETLAVDCGTGGSKLYASSENILFPWFSCVLWIRQYLIPYMPFPFNDTVAWAGPPLWTGGSENI